MSNFPKKFVTRQIYELIIFINFRKQNQNHSTLPYAYRKFMKLITPLQELATGRQLHACSLAADCRAVPIPSHQGVGIETKTNRKRARGLGIFTFVEGINRPMKMKMKKKSDDDDDGQVKLLHVFKLLEKPIFTPDKIDKLRPTAVGGWIPGKVKTETGSGFMFCSQLLLLTGRFRT